MFTKAIVLTNKQALTLGLPTLYCDGEPILNSSGDNVAAFQVTINAQNLFSLIGNPSAASTTTVYKSWLDAPPDVSKSWSIMLASGEKPVQFIRYENKAGLFIGYFKHAN